MKIILANPRGFCAGVERAIQIVESVLKIEYKKTVYVFNEIVHNLSVVKYFKEQKGVVFVNTINRIPNNSICIFSAHGVSKEIIKIAKNKNLKIYDATCPLVKKVHKQVEKASLKKMDCIFIGHKHHPEVVGTLGQYEEYHKSNIYLVANIQDVINLNIKNKDNLMYVTQTTLSIDETNNIIKLLKQKYPNIKSPNKKDICYATQNRQDAVKKLLINHNIDILLVIGSKNSSNSNRLREIAEYYKVHAYLIDNKHYINLKWFYNKKICGITAGASAPEYLVKDIILFLQYKLPDVIIEQDINYIKEEMIFKLPKGLSYSSLDDNIF